MCDCEKTTGEVFPSAKCGIIATSQQVDAISDALSKAQGEFKSVAKSGENKFDRYNYADLNDYRLASRAALSKHGLSVINSMSGAPKITTRKTAKGGEMTFAMVCVVSRLMHSSGQWIEVIAHGEGGDRADKAIAKAITAARKSATACLLDLATSDDPDRDERIIDEQREKSWVPKEAEPMPPMSASEAEARPVDDPPPESEQKAEPPKRKTNGRAQKAVDVFAKLSVRQDELERYVGQFNGSPDPIPTGQWTGEDLNELLGVYETISNSDSRDEKIAQIFGGM